MAGVMTEKAGVRLVALVAGALFGCLSIYGLWKTFDRMRYGCSIAVFSNRVLISDGSTKKDLTQDCIKELVVVRHSSHVIYRLVTHDGKIVNCPEVPNLGEIVVAIKGII
jgi:hypothetical protein